jgi:deoxyribodipyrimidine photo-lyase
MSHLTIHRPLRTMAPKRKAAAASQYADSTGKKANNRSAESKPNKKIKTEKSSTASVNGHHDDSRFDHSRPEERDGIVNRRYYPAEMSNERCAMYNNNEIPRPIELLEQKISDTKTERAKVKPGKAVLHWFKRDLRMSDNRGLGAAAQLATESGVPLVCLFIVSPEDYEAHATSSVRVDFELRTLAVLKKDLAALDIPLLVTTVDQRKKVPDFLIGFCEKWSIRNVFCNIEYEVDELRRETTFITKCLNRGIAFSAVHDDVVVPPGSLSSGQGKQYAVYTPWYRSWVKYLHEHHDLLEASAKPGKNPTETKKTFKEIFEAKIPNAPDNKTLSSEDRKRFAEIWPAGEHEAIARLAKFIKEKSKGYGDNRNFPASNGTSCLSVHHSAGTLAARTSVRTARDANSTMRLDGGSTGITTWISEIAWRDFYKHVMAHWPYMNMAKPFKFEYTNVEWDYNDDHFAAWCEGRTGYPIGRLHFTRGIRAVLT